MTDVSNDLPEDEDYDYEAEEAAAIEKAKKAYLSRKGGRAGKSAAENILRNFEMETVDPESEWEMDEAFDRAESTVEELSCYWDTEIPGKCRVYWPVTTEFEQDAHLEVDDDYYIEIFYPDGLYDENDRITFALSWGDCENILLEDFETDVRPMTNEQRIEYQNKKLDELYELAAKEGAFTPEGRASNRRSRRQWEEFQNRRYRNRYRY